ncbi:MAG: translation initiation factor IF-3 [Candidatus Bipolaricaulia bacterium]
MLSCSASCNPHIEFYTLFEEVGIAKGSPRVNEGIRVDEVRVVDPNGEQVGIMSIQDALQKAKDQGLDLVEVAPQADPPVCKIVDYGKYKYRQEKKQRKQQKSQQLKEMRLTSRIDDHDFDTKIRHIKRFLKGEDRVRVTMTFRGREIVHMDRGREMLERLKEEVQDVGRVESGPTQRGRALQMMIIPDSDKSGD